MIFCVCLRMTFCRFYWCHSPFLSQRWSGKQIKTRGTRAQIESKGTWRRLQTDDSLQTKRGRNAHGEVCCWRGREEKSRRRDAEGRWSPQTGRWREEEGRGGKEESRGEFGPRKWRMCRCTVWVIPSAVSILVVSCQSAGYPLLPSWCSEEKKRINKELKSLCTKVHQLQGAGLPICTCVCDIQVPTRCRLPFYHSSTWCVKENQFRKA